MSRILGIDLGQRRIGIAIADDDGGRAVPLTTLRRASDPVADAAAIARLASEHEAAELVVGLPLDMGGGEGEQARITRTWSDALAATGLRVTFRDERLTSHLAEQRVGPMPRGRSGGAPTAMQREKYRARIDREAAAIILQDELDARRDASPAGGRR